MQTFGTLATRAGYRLPVLVLESAAGFYIGTFDASGPVTRESVEYFPTYELASIALQNNTWTPRLTP
jgi:hypothetical protein